MRAALAPALVLAACGAERGDDAGRDAGPTDAPGEPTLAQPYRIDAFDDVRIGSDPTGEHFQRATAAIDLRDAPFQRVTLVADLATTCFPFESWTEPPAGHRWPSDCDAFDRNFEIVLDPAAASGDPPGIELMRAITPFGGPLHVELDVTDVANGAHGRRSLGVHVATWSDASGQVTGAAGGWNVTVALDVVPGPAPRDVLAVLPLYDGTTGEPSLEPIGFDVPEGAREARLEYRATGHGAATGVSGCGLAPAEEFCRRSHALLVDATLVADLDAWRDDCEDGCTLDHYGGSTGFDYCRENPTGAIASVRASRANWCPGSVTPPAVLDVEALRDPGRHTFAWAIPGVGGGGSWRISASLLVFR